MKFLGQISSTVPTGTAPLGVASSTVVANLNADLLDGKHASDFATSTHNHDTSYLGINSNSVSASKWASARTITLGGDLSGSVSIDGSSNVTLTATVADDSHNHTIANVDNLQTTLDGKANSSHSTYPEDIISGYTKNQFYIDTHPENGNVIIPFINNDIAFLLKKGGNASVYYDGILQSTDISNVFDGSPSYWAINPSGVTNISIELTLHKTFTWGNTMYVSFGASAWRSKNITFDVMNTQNGETEWTNKSVVNNNSIGEYFITFSHNNGTGFNKIRLTFNGWATATIFRIAQIGIINYGSEGLKETFVSRGGSSIYGNFYPHTNSAYNLGTSSLKWANVYADTFTGSLSGNATSATNADTVDNKHASDFASSTHNHDTVYAQKSHHHLVTANGYDGLTKSDGSTTDWIRTTVNGIIPYQSGSASALGTSSWQFNSIYGVTLYENNVSLASKYLGINAKATDSDKLDSIDSANFVYGKNATGTNTITDFNNLYKSQFFEASNATNAPETGWLWGINISHTSDSSTYKYNGQIAIGNGTDNAYFRSTDINGAGTWREFYHTGNFTPSNYSLTTHNHSGTYEPVISTKETAFNQSFADANTASSYSQPVSTTMPTAGHRFGTSSYVARADHTHDIGSHTHTKANITDFPSYGTTAGTICQGNDSRLSDARTPVAHTHTKANITDFAHSHAIGDLPVATSGTSSTTQLVRADDSRLSNARTPVAHRHNASDIDNLPSGGGATPVYGTFTPTAGSSNIVWSQLNGWYCKTGSRVEFTIEARISYCNSNPSLTYFTLPFYYDIDTPGYPYNPCNINVLFKSALGTGILKPYVASVVWDSSCVYVNQINADGTQPIIQSNALSSVQVFHISGWFHTTQA